MSETYEIECGSRRLMLRDASTPQHAVVDYLRSLGCRDAELVRLAPDGVAWRGAVYNGRPPPELRGIGKRGIVGEGREEVTRCPGSWCC